MMVGKQKIILEECEALHLLYPHHAHLKKKLVGVKVFFYVFVRTSGVGIGTYGTWCQEFLEMGLLGRLPLTHEGEPLSQKKLFPLLAMTRYHTQYYKNK